MDKQATEYFTKNFDYFKGELSKVVSFKSISADKSLASDIEKEVEWLETKLKSLGFQVKIIKTSSNPIIIASRIIDKNAKTVLLYGHADVQPVEPISDWNTDPFTLTEKDGVWYGRGIMDNKGQFMMHISSIESLIKSETQIPLNIKFLIEFDEETGSEDLNKVVEENKELLKADIALLSDGELHGTNIPLIEASFRGVVNCEINVYGPKEDLHSGVWGGLIANPAFELSKLISKMYDEDYRVTIPHFYDDVEEISEEEKNFIKEKKATDKDFLELSGSTKLIGEKGFNNFERAGLRPTLQVCGLTSGYSGVGFKNVVPHVANAKFNFRLVTNQNPQKIYDNFAQFIKDNISDSVTYDLSKPDMVEGVKVDIHNESMEQVVEVLKDVYGNPPEVNYVGGTLPVVNALKESLNLPIASIPLAQEDCGMHAPNERLYIESFKKGVEFSIKFLTRFK